MPFEVKIIEDSYFAGSRLTTLQLKYPRFIHSEFMTHRVFSRNASSSRAIPVAKMIQQVEEDPAMPIHWGKNQPGMQAKDELELEDILMAKQLWVGAASSAVQIARYMVDNFGLHKQVANRILEPYQWMSVVCTASDFQNFFELRSHVDAQPEIKLLSDMMKKALDSNEPKIFKFEDYHLPYVSQKERETFPVRDLVKFSVARCARVSYLTHDGAEPSPEKDIKLYEALVGSKPLHASPAEHQARPWDGSLSKPQWNGNFNSAWVQYRKLLEASNEDYFYQYTKGANA